MGTIKVTTKSGKTITIDAASFDAARHTPLDAAPVEAPDPLANVDEDVDVWEDASAEELEDVQEISLDESLLEGE